MLKRFLLIIFYGSWVFYAQAQHLHPLEFVEELFDFGSVPESGGPVLHQFEFTNVGTIPVKIVSVKASCGCTTPGWTEAPVPPGGTGYVQAEFDPNNRPGYFSKMLTVETDFSNTPITLQIRGEVTNEVADEFQVAKGSWRLRRSIFNLGRVYRKDELAAKTFLVKNTGELTTRIKDIIAPPYIKVDVIPQKLAPHAQGSIRVSYNGHLKDSYGFQTDYIEIHTDDLMEPVKRFVVYATLEDYFGDYSQDALQKAPRVQLTPTKIDFGTIKHEQPLAEIVSISNTGKSPLEIRYVQTNCSCLSTQLSSSKIQVGESATLNILFNTEGRVGSQLKAITIYTNDPVNPVQTVTLSALMN